MSYQTISAAIRKHCGKTVPELAASLNLLKEVTAGCVCACVCTRMCKHTHAHVCVFGEVGGIFVSELT